MTVSYSTSKCIIDFVKNINLYGKLSSIICDISKIALKVPLNPNHSWSVTDPQLVHILYAKKQIVYFKQTFWRKSSGILIKNVVNGQPLSLFSIFIESFWLIVVCILFYVWIMTQLLWIKPLFQFLIELILAMIVIIAISSYGKFGEKTTINTWFEFVNCLWICTCVLFCCQCPTIITLYLNMYIFSALVKWYPHIDFFTWA